MERERERIDGGRHDVRADARGDERVRERSASGGLDVEPDREPARFGEPLDELLRDVRQQAAGRVVEQHARGAEIAEQPRLVDEGVDLHRLAGAVDEADVELASRRNDRLAGRPEVRDVVQGVVEAEDVDPVLGRARDEPPDDVDRDRLRPDEEPPAGAVPSGVVVRASIARMRSRGSPRPGAPTRRRRAAPETSRHANPARSRISAIRSTSPVGTRPASGSCERSRTVVSNSWGTGGSLRSSTWLPPRRSTRSSTGPARLSWSETVADRREQARGAFERRSWSEAFAELATARDAGELGAEDLERLAVAAYMVGQDDACETAWMDAHRAWVVWTTTSARPGARSGTPRAVLPRRPRSGDGLGRPWQADAGTQRRRLGRTHLVDHAHGAAAPVRGKADAVPVFTGAEEAAVRLGDDDAATFARLCLGVALVFQGRTAEGMALLDEVMVAVTGEEVSPVIAGIAYCQVIASCQGVLDLRRAREWTKALSRWCDAQPGLVRSVGTASSIAARSSSSRARGRTRSTRPRAPANGSPARLRGTRSGRVLPARRDPAAARRSRAGGESFRRASTAGTGAGAGAVAAPARAGPGRPRARRHRSRRRGRAGPLRRCRLLPALAEIALADGDVDAARDAADELAVIAAELDAPYADALASHARGAVLLADGQPRAARTTLRRALDAWRELGAPYDAARARVLLGIACGDLGDTEGADLEHEAARRAFAELGAVTDLERLAGPGDAASPARDGLSPREVEVLTLVAAGKTNKAIALELFISEKTVGRHVSNILAKLGLASRTEATAYAFRRGLAR